MATDDAIDSVRDKDLDFTEMSGKLNPLSTRRPGRDLNPSHELDRLV